MSYFEKLLNLKFRHILAIVVVFNAGGALKYYYYDRDINDLNQSFSRLLSRQAGKVATTNIPTFLRSPLFSLYGKVYEVDFEDMREPDLSKYATFQEFFTRLTKPRTFAPEDNLLIAPADSRVLSFSEIKGDETLLVKNMRYRLGHFLTGQPSFIFDEANLKTLKKREDTKLYSVIFYLAPGDYHRYHCPTNFAVQSRSHIAGHLAPVKVSHIETTPGVYEGNERVALFGRYPFGFLAYVLVGALNVGSMTLAHEPAFNTNQTVDQPYQYKFYEAPTNLPKGSEVGMFRLGSTIVMVFEAKDVKWRISEGQKCRWGEVFAEVN